MTEPRRNRQCGIGYHYECSDPFGESCECECHPWELQTDLLAVVRRGVESGTIKGEVVLWCEAHRNEAWEDDRTLMRCIGGAWVEGANAWDCHIVAKLLIPVSDGGSET